MTEQRNILGTVGPRYDVERLTDALLSARAGTYSLAAQSYRGDGIVVAVKGTGRIIGHTDAPTVHDAVRHLQNWLTATAIPAVINFPAPFHRPRYFGIWIQDGIVYLDVVEVFGREELEDAIAAGRDRNQIAIWDNGRKEEIATGGTGAVD